MTRSLPAPHLLLAVAAGGAGGGVLRWSCTELVGRPGPAVTEITLVINVVGSLLLALLPLLLARVAAVRRQVVAAALGPGLLGGFTTLSAASEQTRVLLAAGEVLSAGLYLVGTLAAAGCAVALASRLAAGALEPTGEQ